MATYIAFLRAINLGATRKFPKAAILEACEDAGCTDVETYLNTGNVRVTTSLRGRARVEQALEQAFRAEAGFDVPTVVFTPKELSAIAAHAERLSADHSGLHYVSLLKKSPTKAQVAKLDGAGKEGERAVAEKRGVHLLLGKDYHTARLTNAVVEKHLGPATNRNLTVIRTLADRWGA
ncbi:MAG: DUF1697 domain-containing protein [Nocardioides sp.]